MLITTGTVPLSFLSLSLSLFLHSTYSTRFSQRLLHRTTSERTRGKALKCADRRREEKKEKKVCQPPTGHQWVMGAPSERGSGVACHLHPIWCQHTPSLHSISCKTVCVLCDSLSVTGKISSCLSLCPILWFPSTKRDKGTLFNLLKIHHFAQCVSTDLF